MNRLLDVYHFIKTSAKKSFNLKMLFKIYLDLRSFKDKKTLLIFFIKHWNIQKSYYTILNNFSILFLWVCTKIFIKLYLRIIKFVWKFNKHFLKTFNFNWIAGLPLFYSKIFTGHSEFFKSFKTLQYTKK